MIKPHLRKIIIELFESGTTLKEISRTFKINIKTVRKICREIETGNERKERKDKKIIDIELLNTLYNSCNGYAQRMYEILNEEYQIDIGYSSLTRMIREQGLRKKLSKRSGSYPDVPGEEMQHDTSIYNILLNGRKVKVVCASIYLRYSKMLYVKFYLRFNRIRMKWFLHEAFMFWGYSARICIIDNTNLAVASGTGSGAVMFPEMKQFAGNYGFEFIAHEIKHSNRKAGEERSFFTVVTNFFSGRTFKDLTDLNNQVFQWATQRKANRPMSKTKLVPVMLFESEKTSLNKLNPAIHPPYLTHIRKVDQYGYVALETNYYWIPPSVDGRQVTANWLNILEYQDRVLIYEKHRLLISYTKPPEDVRNQKLVPAGVNTNFHEPKSIKKPCDEEEKKLRLMGDLCNNYLDFIHSTQCKNRQKPKLIRELYYLSRKMTKSLFFQTIERALTYQIEDIKAVERISIQLVKNDSMIIPDSVTDTEYQNRDAYQNGRISREMDLNYFQDLLDNEKDE